MKAAYQLSLIGAILLGMLAATYFQNGFLQAVQTPSLSGPDARWLERTTRDGYLAYKITIPAELETRIVGIPVARNAEVWSPREIAQKLTIAPNDGVAEVTSVGFDDKAGTIILFWDADAVKRYGNRPYYSVIYYGGVSKPLAEVEKEYVREIGNTGIYMAEIPVAFNAKIYKIFKVWAQAPPPELSYEINWYNRVNVKYAPDCDC